MMYIAGGYDRTYHCDRASVECYCPDNNEWKFIAELEKARSGLSLVSLNNHIYAVGGRNRGKFLTETSGMMWDDNLSVIKKSWPKVWPLL